MVTLRIEAHAMVRVKLVLEDDAVADDDDDDDDHDVLVRATPENSARVHRALAAFGAPVGPHGVESGTFAVEGRPTASVRSRFGPRCCSRRSVASRSRRRRPMR
jgi:hypothetical protein